MNCMVPRKSGEFRIPWKKSLHPRGGWIQRRSSKLRVPWKKCIEKKWSNLGKKFELKILVIFVGTVFPWRSLSFLSSVHFLRKSLDSVSPSTEFLIISDCRRPTDLGYFKSTFTKIFIIEIRATLETRAHRGFQHCPEIDEAESECALDDFQDVDAVFDNDDAQSDNVKTQIKTFLPKIIF